MGCFTCYRLLILQRMHVGDRGAVFGLLYMLQIVKFFSGCMLETEWSVYGLQIINSSADACWLGKRVVCLGATDGFFFSGCMLVGDGTGRVCLWAALHL